MTSQSASLLGNLPSSYLWKCRQRGFAGNLVSQAFSGQNWGPMSVPALTACSSADAALCAEWRGSAPRAAVGTSLRRFRRRLPGCD